MPRQPARPTGPAATRYPNRRPGSAAGPSAAWCAVSSWSWGCGRGLGAGAAAKIAIEIEDRCRVVADQLELRDDLARGLLLLDLLGEEPLQLGDRGEGFFGEGRLVERVDLAADFLLLLERAHEDVGDGVERQPRPRDRLELDVRVARQHEVEQLHRVHVLFLALQPQPPRRAGELLALAVGRHRQVRVRRAQFRVDLAVDRLDHTNVHAPPPIRSFYRGWGRR